MTVADDTSDFLRVSTERQVERLSMLVREALNAWALADADIELIKYRENAVFSVCAVNGDRFVMRVHRPGYRSDAHLLSEFAWTMALADVGVLTPEVVPTRRGEMLHSAIAAGIPQRRQCDLLRWIDGRPIGTIEDGVAETDESVAATYRQLGELAATVHTHGATWQRPDFFSRPAWDVDSLVGADPVFGKFWQLDCLSQQQLDVLTAARDKVRARLQAFGSGADRYGLIHGDFLPENVYTCEDGTRLLDFDDCGESWYVFELATSIYFLRSQPNYDLISASYVDGYRSVRALPDEHLAMMPDMLMARGLSYLGWPAGRPEIESAREIAPLLAEDTVSLAQQYLTGSNR
jgi:Ser/Thr protein kinase RdoA (MazF antagonist)